MKNQIKLFLNGMEIDLKEDLNILFTYQLEDRTDPTIIKNHYSKTITIEETEGTPHNHLIFGTFFRNDRRIGTGGTIGNQFDPSKRVPFELYVNGDLRESGYAQLSGVKTLGKQINYSINLYGGLGDFWYSLSLKDDGETRSLADLKWNNRDAEGNLLSEDEEFDFTINKETVLSAWTRLDSAITLSEKTLFDTINFTTIYEGVPNDFSADKMLVNTYESPVFPSDITSGSSSYTAYDGYGMAELGKSYDSFAVRDLRSYLQKPVLSIRRLFETCCNPANNGGYTVDLDPSFFNAGNPYYQNAFMTLPGLNIDSDKGTETLTGNSMYFNSVSLGVDSASGTTRHSTTTTNSWSGSTLVTVSGDTLNTDSSQILSLVNYPFSYLELGTDVGLVAEADTTRNLYLTKVYSSFRKRKTVKNRFAGCVFMQLVAYNADTDEKIGGSDIYRFNAGDSTDRSLYGTYEESFLNQINKGNKTIDEILGSDFYPGNIVSVAGNFQYDSTINSHKFVSADNYTSWRLSIDNVPRVDNMYFKLAVNNTYIADGPNVSTTYYNFWGNKLGLSGVTQGYPEYNGGYVIAPKVAVSYGGTATLSIPSNVSSGTKITKKKLLSTDENAADFILSYSKLFGLYWWKDPYEKTIYCRTRNNFFNGNTVDLSDKIDYSRELNITPLLFDKHFYTMSQTGPDTKYSERYEESYSRIYGNQKINTNFNFNNDSNELYDNNVFTNLIQVRDTGDMYRTYYDKEGNRLPNPIMSGFDYKLYYNGITDNEISIARNGNEIDNSRTVDFYSRSGYDFMTRPAAYTDDDGDSRSTVSNKYTLLFFNQFVEPKDVKGNDINLYLTDDLNEMITLNENRCWLYTDSCFNQDGDRIAYQITEIPEFSRYYKDYISWDFGTPQEYYIDNLNMSEEGTLYQRYWKKFLGDQFNANTRVLSCYVKFDDKLTEETLRRFYWFENRIWILNKVTDYNVTSNKTVKCEFISVDEPDNYTSGQNPYA